MSKLISPGHTSLACGTTQAWIHGYGVEGSCRVVVSSSVPSRPTVVTDPSLGILQIGTGSWNLSELIPHMFDWGKITNLAGHMRTST